MNILLFLSSIRALYIINLLVILTGAAAALTWSEGQQCLLRKNIAVRETIRIQDRFISNYSSKDGYSFQAILVAIVLSTINICLLVCMNIRQSRLRNRPVKPHMRKWDWNTGAVFFDFIKEIPRVICTWQIKYIFEITKEDMIWLRIYQVALDLWILSVYFLFQ